MSPTVEYTCRLCGAKFPVEQGSKRKLCLECLSKQVLKGRPKKGQG